MYRTNKRLADEENAKLSKLLKDLAMATDAETKANDKAKADAAREAESKIEPAPAHPSLKLDAWSIFRQWTYWDSSDPNYSSRVLSFWYALAFSLLLELLIFATTPRKEKLEAITV